MTPLDANRMSHHLVDSTVDRACARQFDCASARPGNKPERPIGLRGRWQFTWLIGLSVLRLHVTQFGVRANGPECQNGQCMVNQHIAASDHDASAKPPAIRPGEGTDDSAAADTCSLTVGHRRVHNSLSMHVRRCRILA